MATEIRLPRLGQGMEAGTIVKWLKSEGDHVEKGEALYELDTDKVTQEVESDASGVLLKIAVREGEVEVGRTVAVIGEAGEDVPASADPPPAEEKAALSVSEDGREEGSAGVAREDERERGRATTAPSAEGSEPATPDGRVKASPLARRIARERGLDLAAITGTGPDGRIVAEDIEHAAGGRAPAPPAAPEQQAERPGATGEAQPLSKVRRTIARRLTEAWQVPVFQLTVSADMLRANELLERLRQHNPEVRITSTDILTKLCAAALIRHPALNAAYGEDEIRLFASANIGIAVAAPQGLVVPVISSCEQRSIAEIATARADLVERARSNRLRQADLDAGTFTISNLGMYGVEQFTAVLNPPQAAILAVGAIADRVVARDGVPVVRPLISLTLTCDHRAVDGAAGADFLHTVKASLEEPGLAL